MAAPPCRWAPSLVEVVDAAAAASELLGSAVGAAVVTMVVLAIETTAVAVEFSWKMPPASVALALTDDSVLDAVVNVAYQSDDGDTLVDSGMLDVENVDVMVDDVEVDDSVVEVDVDVVDSMEDVEVDDVDSMEEDVDVDVDDTSDDEEVASSEDTADDRSEPASLLLLLLPSKL